MTDIRFDGVSVNYGDTTAIDGMNLVIRRGTQVGITGPSGSGKTTLLKVSTGLLAPTEGSVQIGKTELGSLGERKLSLFRASNFGFVYQDYNLISYLTALENVRVSSFLRSGLPNAADALEAVGLRHRSSHLPHELSGGEQQRVSVARALCGGPSLIVADEPTGALDSENSSLVLDLLLEASHLFGATLLVVTHYPEIAARLPRSIRLMSGKIEYDNGEL